MSYYYDQNNIAATLKRAIAQGASYDEVRRLQTARNNKIDQGGAAMAQYKNDALSQEASRYLADKSAAPALDIERFEAARKQVAANNLRAADAAHRANYNASVKNADSAAQAQKKAIEQAYRKSALADREHLAAIGLDRGEARPSSGYGESARTAAFLGYQNAVADAQNRSEAEKAKALSDYNNAMAESRKEYNNVLGEIAADSAEMAVSQFNKNREYKLEESKHNADVHQFNQTFDAEREDAAAKQAAEREQFMFDKALASFQQTGIVDNEAQAQILGLPVGTKTINRADIEDRNSRAWNEYIREDAWHEDEMDYKNRELAVRERTAANSNRSFTNAYNLFKAVGEVMTPQMAAVLNLPVGTKYWEYEKAIQSEERQQQKTDFETGVYNPYYKY